MGQAVAYSLLGGAIGGGIYGSTTTAVNGHAVVHFALKDVPRNSILLQKDYIGFHTERRTKFQCDTGATKARVVTLAFSNAVAQFKADVPAVLMNAPLSGPSK